MAEPLPFSESELRLLQILLKRKVRFMVVGLSAATLQWIALNRRQPGFPLVRHPASKRPDRRLTIQ